jgi:hypothetical protein
VKHNDSKRSAPQTNYRGAVLDKRIAHLIIDKEIYNDYAPYVSKSQEKLLEILRTSILEPLSVVDGDHKEVYVVVPLQHLVYTFS